MLANVYKLVITYLEQQKYYYSLITFAVIILLMNNNLSYGLLFLAPFFLTYMTTISIFISEKSDKTERFFCSLPITRKEIVISKYISLILFALINILMSIGIVFLLQQLGIKQSFFNNNYIILFFNAILLFASLTFPFFFVLNDIKLFSRLSFFLFIIVALGKKIMSFFYKIIKNHEKVNFIVQNILDSNYLFYLLLLVILIIYLISYMVSVKLYRKKEL